MIQELQQLDIPSDIAACDAKLNQYVEMIAAGESPRMAAMLASQTPPGIGITDTIYIADQNRHGRSILDRMQGDTRAVNRLKKQLASRGYTLSSDDHYIPTAARFPGDPEAIVNNTQSLQQLQEKVKARQRAKMETPPPPAPRLSPRTVQDIDAMNLKADPSLARTSVAERHSAIVERHGAKKGSQ